MYCEQFKCQVPQSVTPAPPPTQTHPRESAASLTIFEWFGNVNPIDVVVCNARRKLITRICTSRSKS